MAGKLKWNNENKLKYNGISRHLYSSKNIHNIKNKRL